MTICNLSESFKKLELMRKDFSFHRRPFDCHDLTNYNALSNIYITNLTQNKMNLFVLSGHGSESFAAFLNGVILQTTKKRGSYHCSCHNNISRE